jgi:membrane protease YdiL (CAAX protease family)
LNIVASYLAVLNGAPAPSMAQLAEWPNFFIMLPIFLLVPGVGGAWEEPGWRGFALHRLEAGRSRLWALLPLWIIISVWHLPLFFNGGANWVDIPNMIGGVIIYNWLYHRSGHSVLLIMVIHASNNAISDYFFGMFTGPYLTQQVWMKTLAWGIVAAMVLIANWKWWTETDEVKAEQPTATLLPTT